jgi:AcrR family transcriptional regulator
MVLTGKYRVKWMSLMETKRASGGRETLVPPRERILEAARNLFYRHGIRAVGVDAIAQAAGTNKMTLYRHFASKDALVAAYLRRLADEGDAAWDALAAAHAGDPRGELQAWVQRIGECMTERGERGCALANAAVELPEQDHPARRVIEDHKKGHRERLARLCREAGLAEPERLADEVFLLFEGARISIQSVGPAGPGSRLVGMVQALIRDHGRRARQDR